MTLHDIIKITGDYANNIINAYCYGSKVYGTQNGKSDDDFIFVLKDRTRPHFLSDKINVTYYSTTEFIRLAEAHEISILECLFLPEFFKLKENLKLKFVLDKSLLRKSISAKASNSFVKAKKKLTVKNDYNYFIE